MVEAESQLLHEARQGNTEALTALLYAHGPAIRRQVGAALDPRWQRYIDLDDLMQVSYLEVFLSIRQFSSRTEVAFRAWLLRIARNNLLDAIRELRQAKNPDAQNRLDLPEGDESYVGLLARLTSWATPSRSGMR